MPNVNSKNSSAKSGFNFNDLDVYDLSKDLFNSLQLLSFD